MNEFLEKVLLKPITSPPKPTARVEPTSMPTATMPFTKSETLPPRQAVSPTSLVPPSSTKTSKESPLLTPVPITSLNIADEFDFPPLQPRPSYSNSSLFNVDDPIHPEETLQYHDLQAALQEDEEESPPKRKLHDSMNVKEKGKLQLSSPKSASDIYQKPPSSTSTETTKLAPSMPPPKLPKKLLSSSASALVPSNPTVAKRKHAEDEDASIAPPPAKKPVDTALTTSISNFTTRARSRSKSPAKTIASTSAPSDEYDEEEEIVEEGDSAPIAPMQISTSASTTTIITTTTTKSSTKPPAREESSTSDDFEPTVKEGYIIGSGPLKAAAAAAAVAKTSPASAKKGSSKSGKGKGSGRKSSTKGGRRKSVSEEEKVDDDGAADADAVVGDSKEEYIEAAAETVTATTSRKSETPDIELATAAANGRSSLEDDVAKTLSDMSNVGKETSDTDKDSWNIGDAHAPWYAKLKYGDSVDLEQNDYVSYETPHSLACSFF
jgi:hypothetical protein